MKKLQVVTKTNLMKSKHKKRMKRKKKTLSGRIRFGKATRRTVLLLRREVLLPSLLKR